jgi:hypothetical protein
MTRRSFFYILTALFSVSLLLVSAHGVYAADSGTIAGDSLCGASSSAKCTPDHLKTIAGKLLKLFVYLGSAILVVVLAIRFLTSLAAYMRGDSAALTRAKNQALSSVIGFVIIIVIFGGGFMVLLKSFGVKDSFLQLIKLFSEGLIEHAYAADAGLPNPLASNSAYDILTAALKLMIRFFIYPALIALWVASGFKFVTSQGNPEGLKTARGWLFYTVIVTVVVLSLQGFVAALRATADRITGSTSQTVQAGRTLG